MKKKEVINTVGLIGNYYGSLNIKDENGVYFWSIENWDGNYWEEIPKSLYNALVKFERQRRKKDPN
jgi:hypothetical protein